MVELVLKNMDNSVMKIAELKRRLPKKINHGTLMTILDYLQENGKIAFWARGVCWTYTPKKILNTLLAKSTPYEQISGKYRGTLK